MFIPKLPTETARVRVRITVELDGTIENESALIFAAIGRILGESPADLVEIEERVSEMLDDRWGPLLTALDPYQLALGVPGFNADTSVSWATELNERSEPSSVDES